MVHLDGSGTHSAYVQPALLNILVTSLENSALLEQVKCFRL